MQELVFLECTITYIPRQVIHNKNEARDINQGKNSFSFDKSVYL